jgi:hypothetical protein
MLSITGATLRLGFELQREKKRDELTSQAFKLAIALGQYLDGIISGTIYAAAAHQNNRHGGDTDSYN